MASVLEVEQEGRCDASDESKVVSGPPPAGI